MRRGYSGEPPPSGSGVATFPDGKLCPGCCHCFLNLVPHRSISIMKVAQAKLKEIGPDDMNMEEYKVRSFL